MPGAEHSIEVDVTPEQFWEIISDYPRLPEFIPEIDSIRVERWDGRVALVHYTTVMVKRIHYTLELTHHSKRDVRFHMVKGDVIKDIKGFWRLEDLPGGRTRATYHIELSVGRLVPRRILDRVQQRSLPKMLERFKARAEAVAAQGGAAG